MHPVHDRLIRPDCAFHKYTALPPTTDLHLRVMSNCVLANASLCSSEHRIFCGPSLLRHSYDCHSIELQPLQNLFRLLDCLDDCCLVLSHSRNVLVPLVCWACKSSSGHLATHLHHRHLSFDTLELWEPDAAPSWEHWQSHQSARSVTTFKSSCSSDFITTGISTISSMNSTCDTSMIFWISWMVGTVSAQLG